MRLDRLEAVKAVLIAPGAGEVVFDVVAFPINPADLSFCRGTFKAGTEPQGLIVR